MSKDIKVRFNHYDTVPLLLGLLEDKAAAMHHGGCTQTMLTEHVLAADGVTREPWRTCGISSIG